MLNCAKLPWMARSHPNELWHSGKLDHKCISPELQSCCVGGCPYDSIASTQAYPSTGAKLVLCAESSVYRLVM